MAGKLTAAKARSITKPGTHGDGDTLYLNVSKNGAKSWIQRITINGKRHDIGLGGFPVVSLAKARERAFCNRVAVADGRDPLQERRRAKVPSFRQATMATYEANKPRWRNGKHTVSWLQTLERHAYPVLADVPVDRITREDVLRALTPIWGTRQETARRVRQRIRTVLAWAQAHGYIAGDNPAGEGIDGALPSMPAVKQHYRALPYDEVVNALAIVTASRASVAAKLALRFLVLTATRSGEIRNAEWSEVDVKRRLWVIPPLRMKANVEHRVPLSDAALDVLEQARALDDGSGLVFPSPARRGKAMSDMTLTKVLRDNGLSDRCTVHGFRSSFRDWASEKTNTDHAVMELSLAHSVGSNVERAYARSDLLAKRRHLMDAWARYVTGGTGKVVKLRV